MPYFSEGSTYLSEGAKHDFCSQRGPDNTCACESQRKLSWKVIHENGFCQAPFSLSILHQSRWISPGGCPAVPAYLQVRLVIFCYYIHQQDRRNKKDFQNNPLS